MANDWFSYYSPDGSWDPNMPATVAAPYGGVDYSGGLTDYSGMQGTPQQDSTGRWWFVSPSGPSGGFALIKQGYGPGETPPSAAPPPDANPTPTPTPPPGGGDGGGSAPPPSLVFNEPFTPPSPVDLGGPAGIPYIPPTPQFNPPAYTPPPAFSYEDFQLPNWDEVTQDPGYQFRMNQGQQALQQSAAARGVLNGGGTLKDVLQYGQDYASQEYGNVVNRDLTKYLTNRDTALSKYNTNYGTQYVDPYKFNYQSALDQFAPQMTAYQTQAAAGSRQNELNYANAWQRYLQDYTKFRDWVGDVKGTYAS